MSEVNSTHHSGLSTRQDAFSGRGQQSVAENRNAATRQDPVSPQSTSRSGDSASISGATANDRTLTYGPYRSVPPAALAQMPSDEQVPGQTSGEKRYRVGSGSTPEGTGTNDKRHSSRPEQIPTGSRGTSISAFGDHEAEARDGSPGEVTTGSRLDVFA